MATLTKGKTFTNGETVTPQKLHELVDLGTVSGIVNADIAAGAAISDSKLAQIATAGKVANTATTATSANTANAIVVRDAGGSFTAGTITAALSGNAATATTLQTARTINGVSFNGSGNITVTAAPNAHTHAISDTSGLQTALDGKQASGNYAPATGIAPSAITGTAVITTDSRLSDARTPVTHTHDDRYYTESEIDTKLSGLPVAGHTHTIANVTGLQTALDGKQASGNYAPATGIAQSAVTNLTTDLAGKAPTSHTHGNITSAGAINATAHLPVVTTTAGVLTTVAVGTAGQVLTSNGGSSAPSFQTLAATSTSANNLTGGSAGTVPYQSAAGTTAMLAAGTSGQVLRSNGTAAPSWLTLGNSAALNTGTVSGTVATGDHTHTIANVTNLQTTLDGKQASGSYAAATHPHAISDTTGLQTALDSKVSGSNLGLCSAWVNFNHGRMLGVTNAANGESISVTAGSSSGTWNSTVAFSTGQIGIIYYITSAGAVPNASLGGINVSTLGFQIRAISGNTATIKLLAGPATASQTITGNGGTSGFQYISYGIRAQYGVASITKAASGSHMNFTFNFSTPFDFIDYCYQFQMDARSSADIYIQTKGQSSIQLQVLNFSDASVSSQMNFMAFGL